MHHIGIPKLDGWMDKVYMGSPQGTLGRRRDPPHACGSTWKLLAKSVSPAFPAASLAVSMVRLKGDAYTCKFDMPSKPSASLSRLLQIQKVIGF